jgi:hypothetical protein
VLAIRRLLWVAPWLVIAGIGAYLIWLPVESRTVVRFALYRPSVAQFYLDRSVAVGAGLDSTHDAEQILPFGVPGDIGLVCPQSDLKDRQGLRVYAQGRWFLTRHATADIGVFRNGEWLVSTGRERKASDLHFAFGMAGDRPVVINAKGTGNATDRKDIVYGVYRGGVWHLDTQGTGKAGATHAFGGLPQDLPLLIPRWSTDSHPTPAYSLAIFRDGVWHVKPDPDGIATLSFPFGAPGDLPLVSY